VLDSRLEIPHTTFLELILLLLQIVRDEGVAIARLVRKADDDGRGSPSSNVNRWIVSFEGEESEEEISEKHIGRLVDGSNESDSLGNQTPPPAARKASNANNNQGTTKKGNGSKQKQVAHKASKSSSRKTKYNRRSTSPTNNNNSNDRPSTRSSIKQSDADRILYSGIKDNASRKTAKGGKKKVGQDETVVKVKMLTGTLYLYRGENPRAEFIRTV